MKTSSVILLCLIYLGCAIAALMVLGAHEEQYSGPAGQELACKQLGLIERVALVGSYVVGFPLSVPFWLSGSLHGFFWLTAIPNAVIICRLVAWLGVWVSSEAENG